MNMTLELGKERLGIAGFPARLIVASLINRNDLSLAQQHAIREQMPLADAVVALGLVREEDSYAKLAEAGGFEVADVKHAVWRVRRPSNRSTRRCCSRGSTASSAV